MKNVFIVCKCTGEFGDVSFSDIFATDKEYKAKFYCSKANDIMTRYKDMYADLLDAIDTDDSNFVYENWWHLHKRVELTSSTFSYSSIPLKTTGFNFNPPPTK